MPHKWPGALVRGRLLERPNRFLGIVELGDGSVVEAHIADRGRLEAILFPGAEVHLARVTGAKRRTAFTLLLARSGEVLVCIDPAGANRLVGVLLERGLLDLPPYVSFRQEVKVERSRFDFGLELEGGGRLLLEVKSAGASDGEAALFPDAPSERAARHCLELAELARQGEAAAIVMVAQRGDARAIRPHPVDPVFAAALAAAKDAGVLLRGVGFDVGLGGFEYLGPLPILVDGGLGDRG